VAEIRNSSLQTAHEREGSEMETVGREEMEGGDAGGGPRAAIGMSSEERRRMRRRRYA
jgi:hypothetical protein